MENQPNAPSRQWFRLPSIARLEMEQQQQQQQQQQQPPRGPPIRQASLALGRTPLLPTTTTPPPPPLQTESTQNQPPTPAEIIPQIIKQSPPAFPEPTPTLNAQPSPTATPSPTMAPQPPSPPIQPQVPLAQELQQTAQTTNGSYQSSSYVNVPKSLDQSSSPSPSSPLLRPIVTTRAPTPDSPKVIKTSSLPTPRQSPRNGWPTVSPSPNPEPEPKSPQVATPAKTNHFHDNSDTNGTKFNGSNGTESKFNGSNGTESKFNSSNGTESKFNSSNGTESKFNSSNGTESKFNSSNGTESKLITQQAEARKLHPYYNKEERHQATLNNGKDSIAKGSNSKKDEKDMRMITLAGNNLGAVMDLGTPSFHHHHGRKYQLQDQQSESGKDNNKAKGKIADAARYSKPMLSLTNSNVQCVNNSILYNASSIQRSPGVYITFNRRRQTKYTSSSVQDGYPTPQ